MIRRPLHTALRLLRNAPALAALAALWAVLTPIGAEAALAGIAGNSIIRNTITVNYSDVAGNAQTAVISTLDITVNTVAATPSVLSVVPSPGSTDGTGATQLYTFTVRTNSNGPGSIGFAAADGGFVNLAAGAVPTTPAAVLLGSTVIDPSDPMTPVVGLIVGAGVAFKVPNDGGVPSDTAISGGATGDGVVNSLAAGDTVYLYTGSVYHGPFTVSGVTDPAVGAGTTPAPATVVLVNSSAGPLSFSPAFGWQIVEAKQVTVTATQGVVHTATAQNAASWVTTLSATMAGAPAADLAVTTDAHMGKLSVTKYVRNVDAPAAGTGGNTSVTIDGVLNTYYAAGITGKPGEVLEYLAAIANDGTGSSTAVYASDETPTYVTLVTGASYGTGVGTVFARAKFGASETDLNVDASGGSAGTAYGKSTGTGAGSVMSFNLGTGCLNVFPGGGGRLDPLETAYVIYRVRID